MTAARAHIVLGVVLGGAFLHAACGGGGAASTTGPVAPSAVDGDGDGDAAASSGGAVRGRGTGDGGEATSTSPATAVPHAKTKPIVASTMDATLKSLGLDPHDLPQLNKLPPDKLRKVMSTFNKALGVPCTGCHDGDDFRKRTRNTKVSERMWNEYVRGYTLDGGGTLYCDSCHQGKLELLVRDPGMKELSAWMDDNLVGKLKKRSGGEHGCESCHGDPFEGEILAGWAK